MDSKGHIKDPTLRIVPSDKLRDFLVSLERSADMPRGILQFVNCQGETESRDEINTNRGYLLDKEDISNLEKLRLHFDKIEIGTKEPNEKSNESIGISNCDKHIKLPDLDWLYAYLEKARKNGGDVHFHELVEGSEILLPENEVLQRNPVLEARCEKLRNQQLSREYKAMTKTVDNVRAKLPEDTIAYQIKQINKQLIAVAQFAMSVAAGFLFGFLGVDLMAGPLDLGFRLLLGVMCALVIALAEIYFLAKKLNEEAEPARAGGPSARPDRSKPHQD